MRMFQLLSVGIEVKSLTVNCKEMRPAISLPDLAAGHPDFLRSTRPEPTDTAHCHGLGEQAQILRAVERIVPLGLA